jgi:hypothetical protein
MGQCRQQDWGDWIELTRDCGGGRKERGLEMEIVVREIARKAPCFVCERTMLRWPRLYFGGPVRRFEERELRKAAGDEDGQGRQEPST